VLASAFDVCTKHLHPFIPDGEEHDMIWKELLAMMTDAKKAAMSITTVSDIGVMVELLVLLPLTLTMILVNQCSRLESIFITMMMMVWTCLMT
jgi:hypothetical protein